MANWKPRELPVDFNILSIKPGQIFTSQKKLARRWRWGKNRIKKFLDLLQNGLQMVTYQSTHSWTMITICNWERYQEVGDTTGDTTGDTGGDRGGDTGGTQVGTGVGNTIRREEGKEGLEQDKDIKIPASGKKLPSPKEHDRNQKLEIVQEIANRYRITISEAEIFKLLNNGYKEPEVLAGALLLSWGSNPPVRELYPWLKTCLAKDPPGWFAKCRLRYQKFEQENPGSIMAVLGGKK
jgi:hypothetical protein